MFKKYILLLLLIFVCCTFIGCNTDQPENPTEEISSEDDSNETELTKSTYMVNNFENASISEISISQNMATLEFTYSGGNILHLGDWFVLEIYKDGKWYTLPYEIEVTWNAIAYPVEPNQSKSMDYNWEDIYSPLSAGKYRIVTKVIDFKESDTSKDYYLAKEFTIE